MLCIPLSTTVTLATTRAGVEGNPPPSPTPNSTHSPNDTTNERGTDAANVTMVTQVLVPSTSRAEVTDASSPQWQTPLISILVTICGLILLFISTLGILVLLLVYRFKKRARNKLVTRKDEDTKVIQMCREEIASSQTGLGQAALTRRQHTCSRVSSDKTYNRMHDAASPQPEVVVMVESEHGCDHDCYTHEHQDGHVTLSHNYQSHMTPSRDTHVTNSAYPVCNMTDTEHYCDSTTPAYQQSQTSSTVMTEGTSQYTYSPNPSVSSQKQIGPNPSFSLRPQSQTRDSGSSFHHSLAMGGVYSTRTTTPLLTSTHPYPHHTHRGSLTSSHGTGASRRTSGHASRMSHRVSTAGGSAVSSSRTGTSTHGSVNSVMTMHE